METLLIVTNNPAVQARFGEYALNRQADYLQVLLTVRDAIHQGKRLLMHPESGSVTPGMTPYRSLLLDGRDARLDMSSLEMIESALARYQHFSANGRTENWPEQVLRDFQMIDLGLLRQAVEASAGSTFFRE